MGMSPAARKGGKAPSLDRECPGKPPRFLHVSWNSAPGSQEWSLERVCVCVCVCVYFRLWPLALGLLFFWPWAQLLRSSAVSSLKDQI